VAEIPQVQIPADLDRPLQFVMPNIPPLPVFGNARRRGRPHAHSIVHPQPPPHIDDPFLDQPAHRVVNLNDIPPLHVPAGQNPPPQNPAPIPNIPLHGPQPRLAHIIGGVQADPAVDGLNCGQIAHRERGINCLKTYMLPLLLLHCHHSCQVHLHLKSHHSHNSLYLK
jgi:hypothetical protein